MTMKHWALKVFGVGAVCTLLWAQKVNGNFTSDDTFLAIDDTVFALKSNLNLSLCEAQKYQGNPILTTREGGPDAVRVGFCVHVLLENGKFRMWYYAESGSWPFYICYAESDDGYNWTRPSLGLISFKGSTENNIVSSSSLGNVGMPYRDDTEPDPNRRYRSSVYGTLNGQPSIRCFAYSPDGLHWTLDESVQYPLTGKTEGAKIYKFNGQWFMAHQKSAGEYPQVDPWSRYIGISYSSDFVSWQFSDDPGFYFDPKYNGHIQTHITPGYQNYGNVIVAAVGLFLNHSELWDMETDITFIMTNDGFHWRQPVPSQPLSYLLRRGDVGSWDHSFIAQGNMLNIGEKTLLYYCGRTHGGNAGGAGKIQTGVAELRLDGYGYLAPAVGWSYSQDQFEGYLVSKAVLIKESGLILYLNVKGTDRVGDEVKVELQDGNGQVITGYSLAECDNITQDSVGVPVTWSGSSSLEALAGTNVKVKVKIVAVNPNHSASVRGDMPYLYGFYFDKPTLCLNATQKIYPGRGLERVDYRDPDMTRVSDVMFASDGVVEVSFTGLDPNALFLNVSGTGNIDADISGLTSGVVSFAVDGHEELVITSKEVFLATDINRDHNIDLADLLVLINNWLHCTDPDNVACDQFLGK